MDARPPLSSFTIDSDQRPPLDSFRVDQNNPESLQGTMTKPQVDPNASPFQRAWQFEKALIKPPTLRSLVAPIFPQALSMFPAQPDVKQPGSFEEDVKQAVSETGQKLIQDVNASKGIGRASLEETSRSGLRATGAIGHGLSEIVASGLNRSGVSQKISNLIPDQIKPGLTALATGADIAFKAWAAKANPEHVQDAKDIWDTIQGAGIVEGAGSLTKAGIEAVPGTLKAGSKALSSAKVSLADSAATNLENSYRDALNISRKAEANAAEWGKNTAKTLVQERPPINIDSHGKLDLGDAIGQLRETHAQEGAAVSRLIQDSGQYQYHSLDDLRDAAIADIKKTMAASGQNMQKTIDYVTKEFEAYKTTYGENGLGIRGGNGDVQVPTHIVQDIKNAQWDKAFDVKLPNKEEIIANDANFKIGHVAQSEVEEAIPDAKIKEMNARLGDLQQGIKDLQSRNGMSPKRLGIVPRIVADTGGAIAGGLAGGPMGAVAGGVAADRLATALSSRQLGISFWSKMKDILGGIPESQNLVQQVDEIMQGRAATRAATPRLGTSDTIYSAEPAPAYKSAREYTPEEKAQALSELKAAIEKTTQNNIKDQAAQNAQRTADALKAWMQKYGSGQANN